MESTFPGVIAFAVMCVFMLVGTVLRAKVAFLQRNLVPASITGGLVGFALFAALGDTVGWSYDYTAFTFHFFTLSFMSLCLTIDDQAGDSSATFGGLWLSLVWVASLVMQAMLGFGVVQVFNVVATEPVSAYVGALSTHGFTQGPGQALAFGTIWQEEFAIREAANIGIIFASMGFVVSFVVGIPFARWAIVRGINANKAASITPEFLAGFFDRNGGKTEGHQITHPSNIDSLAYHLCLLGFAYLLTHLWLESVQDAIADIPDMPLLLDILFSHNLFFAHGLVFCLIIRNLIVRIGLAHLLDSVTQKRITGSAVDFMVVSALLSIKFAVLAEFLAPIFAVAITIAIATAVLCYVMGKQLKELGLERALAIFGCCTGSTGSGLLLLRLIDPDFKTPVPRELAFFNVAIIILSIHILLFFAPSLPILSTGTFLAVYGGTFILCILFLLVLHKRMNLRSDDRTFKNGK